MDTIAVLLPTDLSAEAGSRVTATIRVRNTGSVVDRFDIDVVGVTGWVQVDPPSLSLFPGAEESATITFAPPRASVPRAGIYPFGVRVRPDANPAASTVEEGRITVIPFVAITAEIAPQTSRAGRAGHHQVVVQNRGNAPADVVVTAVDPDRRLAIGVEPGRAIVGPDDGAGFGVRVQVDDPFPFGPSRPRPFVATVQAVDQAPIQLGATLSQQALLPGWIPRAAVGALALVAVVGGAFFFRLGPFTPAATPTPSPEARQSEAPPTEAPITEAPVTEAPPSEPAGPPTPTPVPPPPKPGELVLAVTGDNGELGANLALDCKKGDACRRAVKESLRTIAVELLNPYTGKGILTASSLAVPDTLPVMMTAERADRPIPWQQVGAAEIQHAQRIVIDLGPLLGGGDAPLVYAVVEDASGNSRRFLIDAGAAQQLFEDLYDVVDMAPPVAATPAPGTGIDTTIVGAWQWDPGIQWLEVLPSFTP